MVKNNHLLIWCIGIFFFLQGCTTLSYRTGNKGYKPLLNKINNNKEDIVEKILSGHAAKPVDKKNPNNLPEKESSEDDKISIIDYFSSKKNLSPWDSVRGRRFSITSDPEMDKQPLKKVTEIIDEANSKSERKPKRTSFYNALVKYSYEDNAVYSIHTAVGKITDIRFKKGESILSVNAGDTINWLMEHIVAGDQHHLLIKPTHPSLSTNLAIITDQRTYYLFLNSSENIFMAGCEWRYPKEDLKKAKILEDQIIDKFQVKDLKFDFIIKSKCLDCVQPLSVFENYKSGEIFIVMPKDIVFRKLPVLFAMDNKGNAEMINYRFAGAQKFVVNGFYDRLKLQYGGKGREVHIYKAGFKPKNAFGSFLDGIFSDK